MDFDPLDEELVRDHVVAATAERLPYPINGWNGREILPSDEHYVLYHSQLNRVFIRDIDELNEPGQLNQAFSRLYRNSRPYAHTLHRVRGRLNGQVGYRSEIHYGMQRGEIRNPGDFDRSYTYRAPEFDNLEDVLQVEPGNSNIIATHREHILNYARREFESNPDVNAITYVLPEYRMTRHTTIGNRDMPTNVRHDRYDNSVHNFAERTNHRPYAHVIEPFDGEHNITNAERENRLRYLGRNPDYLAQHTENLHIERHEILRLQEILQGYEDGFNQIEEEFGDEEDEDEGEVINPNYPGIRNRNVGGPANFLADWNDPRDAAAINRDLDEDGHETPTFETWPPTFENTFLASRVIARQRYNERQNGAAETFQSIRDQQNREYHEAEQAQIERQNRENHVQLTREQQRAARIRRFNQI